MGEVRTSVVLENGYDASLVRRGMLDRSAVRRVETDVLVDTDAINVLLPKDMVEALGLAPLADDRSVEMPFAGPLVFTTVGRTMITDCLVGPPRCEPLLGQIVLERLDLIVDPGKQRLTVRPESPFLPKLKAK